ncbi:MAG: hypothetical protein V4636_20045 [Pseudomonadota bacterium]
MGHYRTVQLLIDRGGGITAASNVFEFEAPILEAMHGSMGTGLVREIGEGTLEIPNDDPADVFATMQTKYGGKVGEAAVTAAYPNVKAFAKALEESRVKPAKAGKDKAGKGADETPKD